MRRFARLLDALSNQSQRNGKLRLLSEYFRDTPDPDRGWALAALTGELDFTHAKPALLRRLVNERTDETLFALSYDYVGDLAETISLIWPERAGANRTPELGEVVETLRLTSKTSLPALITGWLDAMTASERWALIKLMTGGLRVGVSARLAKTAIAQYGDLPVTEIEELWHALEPPFEDLFAWAEGRAGRPERRVVAPFRPVMLAHPLEENDYPLIDPEVYRAEWKWDGIRVQAVSEDGVKRLYSRTGEDISGTFPDLIAAMTWEGALDGELLILRGGEVAPFAELQKRLNRKSVTKKLLESHPAHIRAYDALVLEGQDLRAEAFDTRRAKLEAWMARERPARLDLSEPVPYTDLDDLARLRKDPPLEAAEGLMLKRCDSPYLAGRVKGPWFKWKREPFLIDAVLLYAQRGHGKRSSFYSDYTFGVWREGETGKELVPVGKAYFGFTDEELKAIDKFVRDHTVNKFGPVREVTHTEDQGLVLEVAFEGLQRSPRHKSGVAMRFPRVSRLRWDKPPGEADTLQSLEALLPKSPIPA